MGTMDIFLCFFTGHYNYAANCVEMRWERAVRQYLRTWFIPDIIMFSPEWILFLMRAFQRKTLARFGTLLRILKVSKGGENGAADQSATLLADPRVRSEQRVPHSICEALEALRDTDHNDGATWNGTLNSTTSTQLTVRLAPRS